MEWSGLSVPVGDVVAHRGLWGHGSQPNSAAAILEALGQGLGIETDIRDHQGRVVISHDPPGGGEPDLTSLLQWHRGASSLLALNIKADGLASEIGRQLSIHGANEAFVFDMSFPQARLLALSGIPLATRVSEYEPVEHAFAGPYADSQYLWVDCFESDWFLSDTALVAALYGRTAVLVSPEIHGRAVEESWDWVCRMRLLGHRVGVCTDRPLEFCAWQKDHFTT